MAIGMVEWENGIKLDGLESEIIDSLYRYHGFAFTIPEIMSNMGMKKPQISNICIYNLVYGILMKLVSNGDISVKIVKTVGGDVNPYFTINVEAQAVARQLAVTL